MQEHHGQEQPRGLVAALVPAIAAERAWLRARILADVRAAASREGGSPASTGLAEPDEELLVEAALDWILDRLRADGVVDGEALAALREAGAAAARRGEAVARPLDRVLSAGWVIWEAAVRGGSADGATLGALGTALLRIGDAAAAAIAAGHAEAEQEVAARTAAARRELLDAILELPAGDAEATARTLRRAAALGLDPDATYTVLVGAVDRDLGEEDPELAQLVAGGSPPVRPSGEPARDERPGIRGRGLGVVPIAGVRNGRLIVLAEARWPGWSRLAEGLARLAGDSNWIAVRTRAVEGIVAVAPAAGVAGATLRVALRLGLRGRILDPETLALERIALADETLAEEAVAAELGPLLGDRRMGRALVETVATYLASRGNARVTARRLGLAPRTVAYRLERVRRLLGRTLEGDRLLRLATAIFVARSLEAGRRDDLGEGGSSEVPQVRPGKRPPSAERPRPGESRPGKRPRIGEPPRPAKLPLTAPADRPRPGRRDRAPRRSPPSRGS